MKQSIAQRNFYRQGLQTTLQLLEAFALDQGEIDIDAYRNEIELLGRKLQEEKDLNSLTKCLKQLKESVLQFIGKQNSYIEDRDTALREIIEVMRKAIAGQKDEDQQYHKSIYRHSEKIAHITRLDDLRKIRTSLEQEVTQLRFDIETKQAKEKERMKALDREINSLSHELQRAQKEALTDALTGLNNRKAFKEYLNDLSRKSLSGNSTFALMLLDIDDFKKINDTYGHQAGDDILVLIGEKCRHIVRANDFIGRYGGEEFAVVLPASSLRNAVKKGRQIRKGIADTHYKWGDGGITLRVTVSIGVSVFRKGDTFSSVIERADKALYAAKGAGKNQVFSEKEIR